MSVLQRLVPTVPGGMTGDEATLARVRRGARHVRIGLALNVVGVLALATISATGVGAGQATGLTGFVGALLLEAAVVAALLSGSRIGRALVIVPSFFAALGATGVLAAVMLGRGGPWPLAMPRLPFTVVIAMLGYGGLLATVTSPARAWFRARRAANAIGRAPRPESLDAWRAATTAAKVAGEGADARR